MLDRIKSLDNILHLSSLLVIVVEHFEGATPMISQTQRRTDPNIKRQHATKNGQRDAQHLTGNYSLHTCTKMRRSTTITALELKDWCTTNLSSSRGETSKREQLVLKKQEERKKETIVENPKDGWWERQGDKDFKKTKIKKILEKVRRNRS